MNVFFSLDRDIFEGLLFVVVSKKRFQNISINSCIKRKGTKGRSVAHLSFSLFESLSLSLSLFFSLAVEVVASFCVVPLGGVSERGRQNVATRSAAHR